MTTFVFFDWSANARDEATAKIMNTIAANHLCVDMQAREKSSVEIGEFVCLATIYFNGLMLRGGSKSSPILT